MARIIRILLMEDRIQEVDMIKALLPLGKGFVIESANTTKSGLDKLCDNDYDCVLVDSSMDDEFGIGIVKSIRARTTRMPVIVISNKYNESLALKEIRHGAHDFLFKKNIDAINLSKSIKFSIERHKVRTGLYNMALVDELTGLYNRRGFMFLAGQQLSMAKRHKVTAVIFFADLDGMKGINDIYGHEAGDKVLISAAEVLRSSFRSSDIIARMGGDEFAAFIYDTKNDYEQLLERKMHEKIIAFNEQSPDIYELSVSFGIVKAPPNINLSLDKLLSKADKLMYKQKFAKKISVGAEEIDSNQPQAL